MPTKVWVVGEEVLAADMNAYLQEQIVATFANAAARDAAIPTPKVGMLVWQSDSAAYWYWNGSAWLTIGKGRIASGATTGADRTQGLAVVVQVNFTLPASRLVRIDGYLQYAVITGASNSSQYGNVGYDVGRQTTVAMGLNLPLNASNGGFASAIATLPAGAHTAEVHAVNNSTVGAMRIAATTGAWVHVHDLGGI
jgi:hypothetical protein